MVDYDFYEEFRDPVTYDAECDAFSDDFVLIDEWVGSRGGPLLDLACGTGRMALRLAEQGYDVTGVDLIPEMVDHAKRKAAERGASVEWVVSDARDFHLGRQFPTIFMLMNAFQFLLTRADHEAMLACGWEHLTEDGQFLFETRNPCSRNLREVRFPQGHVNPLPDGGQLVSIEEQVYDPITQIQHYTRQLMFEYADGRQEEKVLRTALRYVYPQEMEALLHYNGFEIVTCYGSWEKESLTAESQEMIVICRKR